MTLDDILLDIHALEDEMRTYERKYNVLTETFYESYQSGEEPPDNATVRDWVAWAGAYEIYLQRREQYQTIIQIMRQQSPSIADVIQKTSRHESISIAAQPSRAFVSKYPSASQACAARHQA